ncbi:hypothetical protein NDI42_10255 [Funiculus sociatus GB2-C1]|uniref:hypothetical protein n=2 Tax=Cyanophyceae TaxID=3028117 RepID=UPI001F54DE38|nr:hypothetical protein [Trichocoleus sp. FACHB-69]
MQTVTTDIVCMQLEFVPVEEFYFALTLAVKTLLDLEKPDLTEQVRSRLALKCGQPSTVAAASQNTFNYVFRVQGIDNSPASALIVSVSDWQGKLRLSSDYGWTLDSDRKPVRTEHFNQRPEFALKLQHHLQDWLQVPITQ